MRSTSQRASLDPNGITRERCRLGNGHGTHLQATSLASTLAASLGVNGTIEINVFLRLAFTTSGNSLAQCE